MSNYGEDYQSNGKPHESANQDNDSVTVNDPFAPENIGILQFIMLSRIYDLLMVDLNERRPEVAAQILELHRKGAILGTAPVLSGQFLANDDEGAEGSTDATVN